MRFLVFYPFIRSFGGIERLLLDMHLESAVRGHRVELLCFDCKVDFSSYCELPIVVHQLKGPRRFFSEVLRLRRFLKDRNEFDQMLVMEMYGAMYAACIRQSFCLHIADTPTLLPRDLTRFSWSAALPSALSPVRPALVKRLKAELVFRLIRRGIRRGKFRATMTRRNAIELERIFGEAFAVIPPGVAEWRSEVGGAGEDCVLLSVCRLEGSKRVDWIIRAFAAMPEPLRDRSRLWIVGDGSLKEDLEAVVDSLGLAERVKFWGHVSESQLEDCYLRSSVFVMPAKQGYGLPGLEALSRGLRLIVHEESGVSEILADCRRATVISDERSLAVAVESCCRTHATAGKEAIQLRTRRDWCRDLFVCFGWQ